MTTNHIATGTEANVCSDIANRQAMGIKKYGQTVAQNPLELKAWLQHAYEEALDQAIYLKRAIEEIDEQMKKFDPQVMKAVFHSGTPEEPEHPPQTDPDLYLDPYKGIV